MHPDSNPLTTESTIHTLTVVPASALGPQIHVGEQPCLESFQPVTSGKHALRFKPVGGLWTSTLNDTRTTGWIDWCRDESFGDVDARAWWRVVPRDDVRVLVIDSTDDVDVLAAAFPVTGEQAIPGFAMVDFGAIAAAGVDAVHVTWGGFYANRWRHEYPNTYSWDCESVVWLRWCFVSVELERAAEAVVRP